MKSLIKWPLLCGLLSWAMISTSRSQPSALYQNDAIISYPGTLGYVPAIDATNFVNNSTFSINYTTLTLNNESFETSDSINFTNIGSMIANTGFNFDTRSTFTGLRTMAGNFYNPGSISCGSINDYNLNAGLIFFFGYGYFNAWATNISNPGLVDVGANGLMQFTGQTVNLGRSRLTIEGSGLFNPLTGFGYYNNLGINGAAYAFGTDTNKDWSPSSYLTAGPAQSSAPVYLYLSNSVSYFDINTRAATNSQIVRAVFLLNQSPNATAKVYFGQNSVGPGACTIEWTGSFTDVASGSSMSDYLYLNNDYMLGSSTNVAAINGIPDNFQFLSSSTPLALGLPATTSGFPPGFAFQPTGVVTNTYSYVDAQLTSSTVGTNSIANQAITNLPGRIEISASKELDLSLAEITGANYLSIQAPNQFDGSAGSYIAVPYADINIGVTNGYLLLTNLLASGIPNWGGEVKAWSGRWTYLDASGVTNDYRVLLVISQLVPTSSTVVQNLTLHGTNTVVADTLNVIGAFSSDAQNLTLQTNGAAVGATSLDGELNFGNPALNWQSSLPNLINLTNYGAIRMVNQANFGGSLVVNSSPTIPANAATARLTRSTPSVTNVTVADKLTIGTNRYAFVTTLTNSVANQIKIDTTFDGSLSNLIAAINHAAGAGSTYSSSTVANPSVIAGLLQNHGFTVTAIIAGTAGNTNQVLTSSTNDVTWGGTYYLTGGANSILGYTNTVSFPYNNLINFGLLSDQASVIYATNFISSGNITNGVGSFWLQAGNASFTNGALVAGGDVTISATNLITTNLVIQAQRSLTFQVSNLISDSGLTNGNIWSVGAASVGSGFNLTAKPTYGDLRWTTVTNYAPTNTSVLNVWAGADLGRSVSGYTNNVAVGRLILDVMPGSYLGHNGSFKFSGAGTSNALYVDYLELKDYATNGGRNGNSYDFPWLTINTNMVIYFAQAFINGQSVAENIDLAGRYQGANGGRLRWIPAYAGYYSSTQVGSADGSTNTVNAALANANDIDSNGNGIPNNLDPAPFFVPSGVNFAVTLTNSPARMKLQWTTIPLATNSIQYRTNLLLGTWTTLTNFDNYYFGTNIPVATPAHVGWFVSPQNYPGGLTNVWIYDPVTNVPHYYRVQVQPWLTYPY